MAAAKLVTRIATLPLTFRTSMQTFYERKLIILVISVASLPTIFGTCSVHQEDGRETPDFIPLSLWPPGRLQDMPCFFKAAGLQPENPRRERVALRPQPTQAN